MRPFRELQSSDLTSALLREHVETYGYVLLRNVLSPDTLRPLSEDITRILAAANWFSPNTDPADRLANPGAVCSDADPAHKDVYDRVFGLPSFHALPHTAEATRFMKMLVGEELLVHPKSAGRLIFPNYTPGIVHAHQDHTAVSGDPSAYTAWIPLHDCPPEQGALSIFEGSHKYGLQAADPHTGYIPAGSERGDGWAGGTIRFGDVLVFHSLTIHQALPNRSDRFRLSIDCRFQNYLLPVNPGVFVFAGSGRRSWQKAYADWPTDDLKFYWNALPVRLKPSKVELAELAKTSDRYARILERVEAEMPSAS